MRQVQAAVAVAQEALYQVVVQVVPEAEAGACFLLSVPGRLTSPQQAVFLLLVLLEAQEARPLD
jgi:hypothetical protein